MGSEPAEALPASPQDPEPDRRPAERPLGWPQWLSIAAVSALVSLVGGAVGLVFAIRPGWRPDPGEKQVARATVVAVERGVSFADYVLNRRDVPADVRAAYLPLPDDSITRCLPGDIYYVQENVEGFKDRSTSTVLFTYNATDARRLRDRFVGERQEERGSNGFTVKHHRTTDQTVVPRWVQWPYKSGQFFVRVEIFTGKKTFLALVDAPAFPMTYERYNHFVEECVNTR